MAVIFLHKKSEGNFLYKFMDLAIILCIYFIINSTSIQYILHVSHVQWTVGGQRWIRHSYFKLLIIIGSI